MAGSDACSLDLCHGAVLIRINAGPARWPAGEGRPTAGAGFLVAPAAQEQDQLAPRGRNWLE
jgi:hypothetical protein